MRMSCRRQRGELRLGVALDENCQHLTGDHRGAAQLPARQQWKADIHHYDQVHTHGARNVDRDVVGDAPVDEQAPLGSTGANTPAPTGSRASRWSDRPSP